jgi:hypothetical protein
MMTNKLMLSSSWSVVPAIYGELRGFLSPFFKRRVNLYVLSQLHGE